jgi:hypothetical protein
MENNDSRTLVRLSNLLGISEASGYGGKKVLAGSSCERVSSNLSVPTAVPAELKPNSRF